MPVRRRQTESRTRSAPAFRPASHPPHWYWDPRRLDLRPQNCLYYGRFRGFEAANPRPVNPVNRFPWRSADSISLRELISRSSSLAPAGKSLALKRNATMSAYSRVLRLPGSSLGIVLRITANRSPAVFPLQDFRNAWPVSGGPASPPPRFSPWHFAQFSPEAFC